MLFLLEQCVLICLLQRVHFLPNSLKPGLCFCSRLVSGEFSGGFFPIGVLDEILNLIESVSEDFPSYSFICQMVRSTVLSLLCVYCEDLLLILIFKCDLK